MSQSCGSKNLSVHKSEMGDKRRMILRKKMRQLLRGIIVLLMATGLAGTTVEADASQSSFQVETTAGDVSGAVGDVVEIPVKISTKQALRGFSGKLSGNYDENILEFQGLDTKELPADAMVSSSGGNFSYLSSSGEHTFSTASYGLKFKILQASEEPVTVTIQDLYYTDGNASSEKVSLTAAVRVNGTGNGAQQEVAVLQMNQYPMREQIPEIMEERQEILHIREQRAATQPGRIPQKRRHKKVANVQRAGMMWLQSVWTRRTA